MFALPFSARRWLASFEAAGGRFLIVGAAATTRTPTAKAQLLASQILTGRRRWIAVYQLAAALGPAPVVSTLGGSCPAAH